MLAPLVSAAIVINELMAANLGEVMSPAINFDSWIELYNAGDSEIDLGGLYLSDDESNLRRWRMPADMGSIPAGGFKVVWLGSNDIKTTQAPFKLDCDGGTVFLSDSEGQLLTRQDYPSAMSRTAWARTTDGGSEWGWTATATPGASNTTATFASQRLDPPVVSTDSRIFTDDGLSFTVDIPDGATLMYTTDGSVPTSPRDEDFVQTTWRNWVKNGDCEGTDMSCLLGKDGDADIVETHVEEGIGFLNSRGIKVHAVAFPAFDWSTQFFVYTPDHIWNAGDKYIFRMKIRADRPCHISVQTNRTPGIYIYGQMLEGGYNITTEWQEIVYASSISYAQAGTSPSNSGSGQAAPSQMQTIAFILNELRGQDNNFYIDDVSWESYQNEGSSTTPSKLSRDGLFTVTETTNFRFRLFQDGFLPSVPVTRSFIKTPCPYTIPVISIVGDEHYFSDPKIGIDCAGDGTNGKTGNGQKYPRNYNMDWDRPVHFSYLSPDGETHFCQDVNISVAGGWTRSQRYRSFKLKSAKAFDGQNRFDFSFFPQKPFIRNKSILLRNGGNDLWTHDARFMDPALETIIQRSGIDLDVQSYVPVVEYVNGQLRGVHNLREPNNDKFVYANFGYDDDEIDMFENFTMTNGTTEALDRLFALGSHIGEPGVYDEVKDLLDIDEFTNYMAAEMFLANDDWPSNNVKAYRSRDNGRYRFISFDLDYAFRRRDPSNPTNPFDYLLGYADMPFVSFFFNLLRHDDYRRKFIDTFCLMGGSVFEYRYACDVVEELLDKVQPMNQLMQQTMTGPDGNHPERAANTIKTNLSGRSALMADFMQAFEPLQLSGTTRQNVRLLSDTEGARLQINGIEVPHATFDGQLFTPVTITAMPPAGYTFAGWKSDGSLLSTDATICLPEGNSVRIEATFTPIKDWQRLAHGITPVRINEVSAANSIYVNDHFKRDDWIELYNTTSEPIDVEGMYLSDTPDNPRKHQITKGGSLAATVIPPHGFLVIWCDKAPALSQLHAPFKLAAEGGDIFLTAADTSWSDCFNYTFMKGDQTAGRYPDGCGNVYLMNRPTIARANHTSSYAQTVCQAADTDVALSDDMLTVRYVVDRLVVRNATDGTVSIRIANLSGQEVSRHTVTLSNGLAEVSLGQLPAGVYVTNIRHASGSNSVIKFIKN